MTPAPTTAFTGSYGEQRALLRAIFAAGVAAAQPSRVMQGHWPEPPAGRLIILACGKAAGSMVAAAETHYLDTCAMRPERIAGLGVARIGYGVATRRIPVIEAGHPVPDAAGLAATQETLRLAAEAGPDDLVLALISGGGSANWVAPMPGITLDAKQALTRALLRSGAAIGEINTVRKHLSRIKGGRLAQRAAPAQLCAFAISDVPHDDPSVIASGPTVPDPSTLAQARAVLSRYGIVPGPAIRQALADPGNETPKPGNPCFSKMSFTIVSRPADALAAAAHHAHVSGYEPVLLGADLEGEARDVAQAHAEWARAALAAGRRVAILSGGELTVTLRGNGRGGPNQEYALALALALEGAPNIAALAGDTDGTDGGAGVPDDPAGALIDAGTLTRAAAAGLDAAACLASNDSTRFFATIDGLLTPGPTLTNVNDLRVILVDPDSRAAPVSPVAA